MEDDRVPEFPRGTALPRQSPLYWVDQKDRYLRQLLILDIEQCTGRAQVVYFSDCGTDAQIDASDDKYLLELIGDCRGRPLDLFLETNGGQTDAAEKVVSVLRSNVPDFRVIVPRRAKSNGTLIALAGRSIVMGPGSELGPIDPLIVLGPQTAVPAQFILQAAQTPGAQADPIIVQYAQYAMMQTQKLALALLVSGMRKADPDDSAAKVIVSQLSTRDHYHSHGSVIDVQEAARIGLAVEALDGQSQLWQSYWLLRCMYEADARKGGYTKIFEGKRISHSIRPA